jgi:hypothetical protein
MPGDSTIVASDRTDVTCKERNRMTDSKKVALVALGEGIPIDLDRLGGKLNRLQNTFAFETAPMVPIAWIGEPDIGDDWYSDKKLLGILRQHPQHQTFDYVIGLTRCKLGDINDSEPGTYFCSNDAAKVSVIGLSKDMLQNIPPTLDEYQYASFLIMSELLTNMSGKDIYHKRPASCLFDYCEDPRDITNPLHAGQICRECLAELGKASVSDSVLDDVRKVLDWCKTATWSSAISRTLWHPLTSLVVGTAVGWLASSLITAAYYPVIIAIAVCPTAILLLYMKGSIGGKWRQDRPAD